MENCHADLLSTIKNKSVVLPEFARLVALKYIKDVLSFAKYSFAVFISNIYCYVFWLWNIFFLICVQKIF